MSQVELTPPRDHKACSRCGLVKPFEDFSKNTATRTGRAAYCKSCAAIRQREYRRLYPERHRTYEQTRRTRHADKLREYDRERWNAKRANDDRLSRRRFAQKVQDRYGITLAEYDEIVAQPCAICGATEGIVLDHCHTTGTVRGPLCKPCNTGLGHFVDNPARLRAAAEYLEAPRL